MRRLTKALAVLLSAGMLLTVTPSETFAADVGATTELPSVEVAVPVEETGQEASQKQAQEADTVADSTIEKTIVKFNVSDTFVNDNAISITSKISLADLAKEMPETLDVTFSDGTSEEVPVTWESVEDYDGTDHYYYEFDPVFPDTYKVSDGLELPYIGVFLIPSSARAGIRRLKGTSNEEKIFNYLTSEMGLNNAAAVGILTNIFAESSFNPNATGDKGTSYGICQWHNGRWNSLKSYCNKNGYDWSSLDGQLHYLQYESEHTYANLLKTVRSVSNNADGAYTAAYQWCKRFEVPANTEKTSQSRGKLARNTYWPKYKDRNTSSAADNSASGTSFTDVTDSSGSYYAAVYWAASKGITTGYSDGTFGVSKNCSRGAFVTFLWRQQGSPEPTLTAEKSGLKDFGSIGKSYQKAVLWAVENKITTGYRDKTFRAGANVTRGAAVTFLYRAAGEPKVSITRKDVTFKDMVPAGSSYESGILWAVENKITTGYSDNTFRPASKCTRGATVTFLQRFDNLK